MSRTWDQDPDDGAFTGFIAPAEKRPRGWPTWVVVLTVAWAVVVLGIILMQPGTDSKGLAPDAPTKVEFAPEPERKP